MPDNDLSHVYTNSDLDAAQEHHGNLPDEMRKHIFRAFAHKAGIAPKPVYKGPAVQVPSDWETPSDEEGQEQEASSEALSNLSEHTSPVIPPMKDAASPPVPGAGKPSGNRTVETTGGTTLQEGKPSKKKLTASKSPDWGDLGQTGDSVPS